MKKLSTRQFATVKRVAQNVYPLVTRRYKLSNKVRELQQELIDLDEEISGHEAGIVALTGGFRTSDLVIRVVEDTGKTKDGQPIKVTKYFPTDNVQYDESQNCYYVKDFFCNEDVATPTEEVQYGSDFDIDTTNL